jgi:type II secretory pathway component PulF
VTGAVAAIVYVLVPPFVPVLARLGNEMPVSARILIATYPFAIVLPILVAGIGAMTRWRLLVPIAYVVAAGIGVFLLLALYVPMFELS